MMEGTVPPSGFKAVYQSGELYETVLPPHYYDGAQDVDLIEFLMTGLYGQAGDEPVLSIAEFGCGTGRITTRLAPYAQRLVAIDSSAAMINVFQDRFPSAETRCADTRQAVAAMLEEGLAGEFDVVAAFWSLSYPLGDCFEVMTPRGIVPVPDSVDARQRARRLVRDLMRLLNCDGHLLVLFFDSDTREQRLVTRQWELVAPFPNGSRGYTMQLLVEELRSAEDRGEGCLTHIRRGGTAVAADRQAALAWFNQLHFKGMSILVHDPHVQGEISAFVDECAQPTGEVIIPTGVHLIDFHATRDPRHHLP